MNGELMIGAGREPMVSLAHGVGRVYELPIPLTYYLLGSALAVVGSFIVALRLPVQTEEFEPKRVLGPAATKRLALVLRVLIGVGFFLALVSASLGFLTTFSFAAIWVWMGLVVALVAANVMVGGIWRLSDPGVVLAEAWKGEDRAGRSLPWLLGPLAVYLLFWFELVSRVGFDPGWLAGFLVLYVLYAVWLRARVQGWEEFDPFSVIYNFASKASFLSASRDGVLLRTPGSSRLEYGPMKPALYASLFILLGATSMDNLRETRAWSQFRQLIGVPSGPTIDVIFDSVALALLAVPFFLSYRLTAQFLVGKGESSSAQRRTLAWSLSPIAIAYVLAHNAPLFLATLPQWLLTAFDPFSLGWRLPGTSGLFNEFRPSPQLVWFVEVGLVVGGHVVGVIMAHKLAEDFSRGPRSKLLKGLPMTALMSLFTVGTLWLLSLSVVVSETS